MRYLVDANVLSEPTKPEPDGRVIEWLGAHESEIIVDAIILGEMFAGIIALPAGRRRRRLEQWFAAVVQKVACLPWHAPVSLRWARLVADLQKKGQTVPILDSMIAATALAHDLTLATRNVRDFRKTGVRLVNPFA